jgi:hypothetical protein
MNGSFFAAYDCPIGLSLQGILQDFKAGEYERVNKELLRLLFFVKHLREIEAYDKNLLAEDSEYRCTGSCPFGH